MLYLHKMSLFLHLYWGVFKKMVKLTFKKKMWLVPFLHGAIQLVYLGTDYFLQIPTVGTFYS